MKRRELVDGLIQRGKAGLSQLQTMAMGKKRAIQRWSVSRYDLVQVRNWLEGPWFLRVTLPVVLLIWVIWFFIGPRLDESLEKAGQTGDSFGSLNALFAAIGSVAIMTTLFQQQRELRSARNDQHRDRFEVSFFEHLRLLRELRQEIRYRFTPQYLAGNPAAAKARRTGPDGLWAAAREMLYSLERESFSTPAAFERSARIKYGKLVHGRQGNTFSPYFRMIYTILYNIMADPHLSDKQKWAYGRLLRSQLTSVETYLLAFNALLKPVSKDLMKYVIEYRMLKYMPHTKPRLWLEQGVMKEAFLARKDD